MFGAEGVVPEWSKEGGWREEQLREHRGLFKVCLEGRKGECSVRSEGFLPGGE